MQKKESIRLEFEASGENKFNPIVKRLDITEPTKVPISYFLSIKDKIELQPDFQREFVWKSIKQKELIKSIWMGIPLPLFYFSQKGENYEVIDGQQRLTTLFGFLDKYSISDRLVRSKLLKKIDVRDASGKKIPLQEIKNKVFNASIHYVSINDEGLSSVEKYDLFVRLNLGAEKLRAQEIRNCILQRDSPQLNMFLKHGSKKLAKLTGKRLERMVGEELVLRFLVISEYGYEKKVSGLISPHKLDSLVKVFMKEKIRIHSKKFRRFIENLRIIFPSHYFEMLSKDETQPKRNKWNSHIFTGKPNQGLFHLLSFYLSRYDSHQINKRNSNKIRKGFLLLLKDKKFVNVITGSGTDSPKKIEDSKEIFRQKFIKKFLGNYAKKDKRSISREAKLTILKNVPYCYLCYGNLHSLKGVAGEHISSFNDGNLTDLNNSLLSHKRCNSIKGKRSPEYFRSNKKSIPLRIQNKANIRQYLKCLKEWNKDYPLDLYNKLRKFAEKDKKLK